MSNYYPDEIIEEVRISNDIVDVVGEYVKLERKGQYMFGNCPFHKEKTPSFSVTPSKQMYYCYGCGKGGNVFHFIMNAENLEFVEAVRLLAERAKIELPEGDNEEEKKEAALKREVLKVNVEAARFFYSQLNSDHGIEARKYLSDRGLTENTVKRFGLGFSGDGKDSLYKYLKDKGFGDEPIIKSGLFIARKSGGYYEKFSGRIIFPIFDIRGNVIGFGGRVTDSSMPKYLNSPETCVYSKGRNLYALNFAKNSGQKKIIVVEGYMDVISLHQRGIINTVASLGTALTESQGRILKKYAEEIIISYDSDVAGQAAALRGLDLLNDIGCNVRVLTVPDGKDPDEFIKKNGPDAFKKLVDSSLSLIEYKIKVLKNQIDTETTEGKINFLNKTADILAKVDNRLEREMYTKKLAQEYEISQESVYAEIIKRTKPKTGFNKPVVNINEYRMTKNKKNEDMEEERLVFQEMLLLSLLCVDNSIYKVLNGRISIDFFSEKNRQAAGIVLGRLEENRGIVAAELLNALGSEEANRFTKIIQNECDCGDNRKAVLDIIRRINTIKLNKREREILDILSGKNESVKGDVEKLKTELKLILQKKKGI
jgi:DNA primase